MSFVVWLPPGYNVCNVIGHTWEIILGTLAVCLNPCCSKVFVFS